MTDRQHDAHMDTRDEHAHSEWKNFPPSDEIPAELLPAKVTRDRYVIAKSDSVEHLYWDNEWPRGWVRLGDATRYTKSEVLRAPEPPNEHEHGFWMPLERAEELEK
jgi:hypothetical protein